MKPVRALIVDDEPLARDLLRELLAADPALSVAGESRSGREAVSAILTLAPDLVFLDVQMPEMDGFAVIDAVGAARMPPVVFVTAYDRYAVRAFEVHALDYLLKPFDEERFARTLQRVKERLTVPGDLGARLLAMLDQLGRAGTAAAQAPPRPPDRLVIHDAGRAFFVPWSEIDWLEAAGKYVIVHAGKAEHMLREPISALEAGLDPGEFVRIHRSTIVRIDRIREVRATLMGEYSILLRDGTTLGSSRGYRDRVQGLLGRRV